MSRPKFRVGDYIVVVGNYLDEQIGEYAPQGVHTVVKIRKVTEKGTSGQWIQTDKYSDWVDSAWFRSVNKT